MLDFSLKGLRFAACGLSEKQAADMFGYSVRHWRRFEDGQATPPVAVMVALRAQAGFFLHPAWDGFRVDDEYLHLPDGQAMPRAALLASHWLRQVWNESQRKNVQLDMFR